MNINTLVGLTLAQVHGCEPESDQVVFTSTCGRVFKLWHDQDCCEHVRLVEVIGDPGDMIGSPIGQAEESSNNEETSDGSQTWTFYRLATAKGSLVLRWLGESDGYYSESVDFDDVTTTEGGAE